MDIEGLSMALSMSKVQQQWGVAMLKNSIDSASTMESGLMDIMDASNAMTKQAMELSVNPEIGSNFDMSV